MYTEVTMSRPIVGIMRGGTSDEYPLSIKTGAALLSALAPEQYETRDIFIDRSGVWHTHGMSVTPVRALARVDVVLNALHGGIGENGTVQRLLDRMHIPYAGSNALASGIAHDKVRTREILTRHGITMPRAFVFSLRAGDTNAADMSRAVFHRFGPPYVVKPASEGGSHGIQIASSIERLPHILADVLERYGVVIVEEYIRGTHVALGVIQDFRGENLYVLPPLQYGLPTGSHIIEPTMHEEALGERICPSRFTPEEKKAFADIARRAHKALELNHFSAIDAIRTPNATYVLEADSIPGLYPKAPFPIMLEAVGSSVGEFAQHSVALARAGNRV